eukprot:TRINITY_DN1380_c0_g2_i6.p1 TRINITY_DN1380_c0_g2~~TRINITY_DN1380_c0_g2_i6.p1  ORF type:complete len:212 (-),score=51.01 TRINITY_DN1380_c0_g2_i6:168-803(-)
MRLLILVIIPLAVAEEGVWLSESLNDPFCLIDNKISWLYVRGFLSSGNVDKNAVKTLNETQELRLDRRIYINPTIKVPPEVIAEKLCNEVIKGLNERFHIYISALQETSQWSPAITKNRVYIEKLRDAIVKRSNCYKSVNILSRKLDWEKLFGRDYKAFSNRVLIWDRVDGNTCDRSKYVPFGGWRFVDGIIYKHNTVLCGNRCDISCLFA